MLIDKAIRLRSGAQKILFCSDPHIKHRPSWSPAPWESRGFSSGDEHDTWFRDMWFKHVDADTIVFVLGDVVFSDPKGEWFRQFTNWPGKTYHIWGNHFSGARQIYYQGIQDMFSAFGPYPFESNLMAYQVYPVTVGNLTFVGDSLHAWIDGQSVWMQHYAPFIWPEMGNSGFALCGHSHGSAGALNPDAKTQGLVLDVGVDNAIAYNKTPFLSWSDVKAIMRGKTKVIKDHHDGSVAGQ